MGGKASQPEVKCDWKDIALHAHNNIRKQHNSPPLEYSKDLSLFAQNQALYLSTTHKLHRSGMYCQGKHVGENIAEKVLASGVREYSGEDVTEHWYKEIEHYSFDENDPSSQIKTKCRNFTQLIWKNSKKVGFGLAIKGKRVVVVACYLPRGNRKGQYAENVQPSATVKTDSTENGKCLTPLVEDL